MTTLREAAQQALERLQKYHHGNGFVEDAECIAALSAALAQQAEPVEPVAWMVYTEGGASAYVTDNPRDLIGAYRALPLYAAPPQRQPLTDEVAALTAQRDALLEALKDIAGTDPVDAALDPQRAVRIARAAIKAVEETK